MLLFAFAYLAAWLGVLWYVARLAARQRSMAATLEALQAQLESRECPESPACRAA